MDVTIRYVGILRSLWWDWELTAELTDFIYIERQKTQRERGRKRGGIEQQRRGIGERSSICGSIINSMVSLQACGILL